MGIVRVPPSLSKAFSCNARSNLGCRSNGMSPTSSRNRRPPVGHLKTADLLRQGAGEGSSLVAEQLAFEEPGRNGGTVQRDERKVPARAQAVNRARHQLLPRAGFPQDQHGRIGRSNHFHLPLGPAAAPRCCRRSPRSHLRSRLLRLRHFPAGRAPARSCTKVIHRNGESFKTAVTTRTGTRVPSLRSNSFSKGVQAPNRKPSSCASFIEGSSIPGE